MLVDASGSSRMSGSARPFSGLTELELCTLELNIKYEVLQSLLVSVCFCFGLLHCFYGLRCSRMLMFFSGFSSSGGAVLLLYHKGAGLGAETKGGAVLAAGLLGGLLTFAVTPVGLLVSGLQLGALLSLGALVGVAQAHHGPRPAWGPPALLLTCSLGAAALALRWPRPVSAVYASAVGACAVTLCVDFLLGGLVLPEQLFDVLCQAAPRPLYWHHWAIAATGPLLGCSGSLVQWSCSDGGHAHTGNLFKRQKKCSKKSKHKEPRRRPAHYRRRRPPPLKRYTGDVLAPSYLQSVQGRGLATDSSSSSLGAVTHTLIDFDFETGSMVPLAAPPYAV